MKLSKAHTNTLREVPGEAEIPSHIWLLRSGMIRKNVSGVYGFMQFGWRTVRKIEQIIREEMDAAGAQEILTSPVQPAELWHESGRWGVYGPELWRLKDRHGREFCLGPTAEEIFTDIVRSEVSSWRQLPINLYQIQTKYRDEVRPRFGLMRSREFIMKDAYSFDRDEAGLDESYCAMREAYTKIFTRCGLRFRPVAADNGAIGGSGSEEFMAMSEYGESDVIYCEHCDMAATSEQALGVDAAADTEMQKPLESVHTPGTKTIDEVSAYLELPKEKTLKALLFAVYKNQPDEKSGGAGVVQTPTADHADAPGTHPQALLIAGAGADIDAAGRHGGDHAGVPNEVEYVAVFIRGDRELNMIKLVNALGIPEHKISFADEERMGAATGCVGGFTGPVGLHDVKIVADSEVPGLRNLCAGACQADHHYVNMNYGRDWRADIVADLKLVGAGDPCPECGAALASAKGIEVGQIFKLGTKYSLSMGAHYRDESQIERPIIMGCYGIGVTRTMAAVVEQCHDEKGIIWPVSVAPYHAIITLVKADDADQANVASRIYEKLNVEGVETLLDDRDERPGVKFNDADIFGIPIRITVGKKAGAGLVEYKLRRSPDVTEMTEAEAIRQAVELVQKELKGLYCSDS